MADLVTVQEAGVELGFGDVQAQAGFEALAGQETGGFWHWLSELMIRLRDSF
jgi:hypothetical protein